VNVQEIVALLASTALPHTVFGVTSDDQKRRRNGMVRTLTLAISDSSTPADRTLAEDTLARLNALYDKLTDPDIVTVGDWDVAAQYHKGSLCDLHLVSKRSNPDLRGVLKVARHPRDNSLLAREVDTLKALAGNDATKPISYYFPVVLDTFEASNRRANVVQFVDDAVPLLHIKGQLGSLPFVHVVWAMNRLLSVLGAIHHLGYVHGAVLPHHLLYRPADHGLVLVDWTCASVPGSSPNARIPYALPRWRDHYPLEVLVSKGQCSPATDIYMAFAAMRWAAGSPTEIPWRFRPLFDLCTVESWHSRPDDAWKVQDLWKQLAEQEYGKPQFVPLTVPVM
jgi:hypothetical protein